MNKSRLMQTLNQGEWIDLKNSNGEVFCSFHLDGTQKGKAFLRIECDKTIGITRSDAVIKTAKSPAAKDASDTP